MKRTLSIILLFVIAVTGVFHPAMATNDDAPSFVTRESNEHVTENEIALMAREMEARDLYDASMTVEPLYDSENEPFFLLGQTEIGYAILERDNGVVLECGEIHPFAGYETNKKYYGGALAHFVKRSDTGAYLHLASGEYGELPAVVMPEPVRDQVIDPGLGGDTYKVINPHYITRYAFGFNLPQGGTCNLVACGIELNYIKRQYSLPIIASNKTPEIMNDGMPNTLSEMYDKYPKAEALHQFLRLYFIYNVNLLWGANYVECVDDYLEANVSNPANRPIFTYSLLPSYTKIKNSILASKPVIVQTGVNAPSVFSLHTMVAYGCRKVTTGGNTTYELLVHTGWYGNEYNHVIGSTCEQKAIYINKNWLTYGYFFTVPGGN